jgi:hypothetical protein
MPPFFWLLRHINLNDIFLFAYVILVLYNFAKKQQDDLDLDLDEEPPESRKGRTKKAAANSNPTPPSLPAVLTVPTDDESLEANGGAKDKKEIHEPASLDWANEILKGMCAFLCIFIDIYILNAALQGI